MEKRYINIRVILPESSRGKHGGVFEGLN